MRQRRHRHPPRLLQLSWITESGRGASHTLLRCREPTADPSRPSSSRPLCRDDEPRAHLLLLCDGAVGQASSCGVWRCSQESSYHPWCRVDPTSERTRPQHNATARDTDPSRTLQSRRQARESGNITMQPGTACATLFKSYFVQIKLDRSMLYTPFCKQVCYFYGFYVCIFSKAKSNLNDLCV